MPMHDWTRVDAGIFHAFHHSWIEEIHRSLLKRLPPDYYSLPEQQAAGFGPDVLALTNAEGDDAPPGGAMTLARPRTKMFRETSTEFYLRKQKAVAIHHVSGDRIVAMVEIVSPGNKNSMHGLRLVLEEGSASCSNGAFIYSSSTRSRSVPVTRMGFTPRSSRTLKTTLYSCRSRRRSACFPTNATKRFRTCTWSRSRSAIRSLTCRSSL